MLRLRLLFDRDRDLEDFMNYVQLSGVVFLIALKHGIGIIQKLSNLSGESDEAYKIDGAFVTMWSKHGCGARTSTNSISETIWRDLCWIPSDNDTVTAIEVLQNVQHAPTLALEYIEHIAALVTPNLAHHSPRRC